MLAQRFAGPVVTGERRADAAALACERFGVDTIVLDDGFQHRALARDADLVLATDDTASGRVLPAGPLREPSAALARARAVLGVDGAPPRVPGVPAFRATLRPTAIVRVNAAGWFVAPLDGLADQPVLAVAGVARPERFVAMIRSMAGPSVDTLVFPDHHPYSTHDADRIGAAARGRLVVTTEKDLAKLARFSALALLCAVRVDLEVQEGDTLVDLLLR
jgi:tetraacyldisaccharide 4'-kinase